MAPWRRALQETGGGSLTITLPKGWANAQGLGKGSHMLIVVNEDGSLTLIPERGSVKREASCATINNSPTLTREGSLVESMVADASVSLQRGDVHLAGAVTERDEEVDRQYFILVRMVRSAIRDPDITRRIGIHPLRLLDMRLVARFLEDSGDEASAIASRIGEVRELSEGMRNCLARLGAHTLGLVKISTIAFLSMEPSTPARMLTLFQETRDLIHQIEKSLEAEEAASRMAVAKVIPRFERIAENSMDIAELTTPISFRTSVP